MNLGRGPGCGWVYRGGSNSVTTDDTGFPLPRHNPAEPLCCIDPRGWRVHSVSWHPDGRSLAVAARSSQARVYDISGERPREQVAVKGGTWASAVYGVAFSPDGS